MPSWILGAAINVVGGVITSLGMNIMKKGQNYAAQADQRHTVHHTSWLAYPGRKVWLLGMALNLSGTVAIFASFAFAAQSLLSALAVVPFIVNILFARIINGERAGPRLLLATAVIIAGCILLVIFGNHGSEVLTAHDLTQLYTAPPYIGYLVGLLTFAALMFLLDIHAQRRVARGCTVWPRWLPITFAAYSAALGTQAVVFSKALASLLRTTLSGDSQLGQWYTWLALLLFILLAVFWVNRFNLGLSRFPILLIMPLLMNLWVFFSMLSGMVYYQEYRSYTALSGAMFGVGSATLLLGIYLLATSEQGVYDALTRVSNGHASAQEQELGTMQGKLRSGSGRFKADPSCGGDAYGGSEPVADSIAARHGSGLEWEGSGGLRRVAKQLSPGSTSRLAGGLNVGSPPLSSPFPEGGPAASETATTAVQGANGVPGETVLITNPLFNVPLSPDAVPLLGFAAARPPAPLPPALLLASPPVSPLPGTSPATTIFSPTRSAASAQSRPAARGSCGRSRGRPGLSIDVSGGGGGSPLARRPSAQSSLFSPLPSTLGTFLSIFSMPGALPDCRFPGPSPQPGSCGSDGRPELPLRWGSQVSDDRLPGTEEVSAAAACKTASAAALAERGDAGNATIPVARPGAGMP